MGLIGRDNTIDCFDRARRALRRSRSLITLCYDVGDIAAAEYLLMTAVVACCYSILAAYATAEILASMTFDTAAHFMKDARYLRRE